MIVIVASRYDMPARCLSEQWAGESACLFTPDDLSVAGWRYYVSDPGNSIAMLGGREVQQSNIRGVLTRVPWVWEGELAGIVSEDRAYVAAEMSAFLLCWLSGLTCPVLNRPTAGCLNGPGWGREQWTVAAAKAGMTVQPVQRRASLQSSREERQELAGVTVTVVGDRCFGDVEPALVDQARRLAGLANADLLGVQFSCPEAGASFVRATTCPDLDRHGVADAVYSYLRRL